MIDLIAEIICVLAFIISLAVVPAWASGLLFGKGSDKPAPSDFPYAETSPNGTLPDTVADEEALAADRVEIPARH